MPGNSRKVVRPKHIINFETISFLIPDKEILTDHNSNLTKICLLVDDDDDDKEIFCLALEQADSSIVCHTANDGREALKMLSDRSFRPDYIFLDLNMPQMDGKECLKEIRKQSHLNHIPVIIFTTSSAPRDIEETKKLGATHFITKPPLVATLAIKLSEIFNNTHT